MKQTLLVSLTDSEFLELCRIIIDQDEPAALSFINQHLRNPANKALAYNVSDTPGAGPTADPNGTMYFQSFAIDTQALISGYFLHFDLYNTLNGLSFQGVLNGGDVDINSFAPFSQTAESPHSVPEPASLLLLGLGLIGITGIRRKFRN